MMTKNIRPTLIFDCSTKIFFCFLLKLMMNTHYEQIGTLNSCSQSWTTRPKEFQEPATNYSMKMIEHNGGLEEEKKEHF